jgi:Phospholipase B
MSIVSLRAAGYEDGFRGPALFTAAQLGCLLHSTSVIVWRWLMTKAVLLQIYQRAGYKAFRDAHARRGADFAAAVSARRPDRCHRMRRCRYMVPFWLLATGCGACMQVEGLSYQLAPRAAVFRRDEGDASDIATLQRLMRSNDWSADSVGCSSCPLRGCTQACSAMPHS